MDHDSLLDTSMFMDSNASHEHHEHDRHKIHKHHDHLPVYEKISHEDNVYLIRTDQGSFKLYHNDLINTLKQLRQWAHLPMTALNNEQNTLLAAATETTRILHNSQALNDLVLNHIKTIFGNIAHPQPGTVGAFFIGCFNHDQFDGPLGCNPRCAASLLKCQGDHFECNDSILVFSNHQFNKLNHKETSHAYIYIDSHQFQTFNHHEVHQLRDAGIERVTLIYSHEDGSYREVTKELTLDQLPTSHGCSSVNVGAVIAVVIIVILILLGVLYVYGDRV